VAIKELLEVLVRQEVLVCLAQLDYLVLLEVLALWVQLDLLEVQVWMESLGVLVVKDYLELQELLAAQGFRGLLDHWVSLERQVVQG